MPIQKTKAGSPLEFHGGMKRAELMAQYRDTGSQAAPLLQTLPFIPGKPVTGISMVPGIVKVVHGLPQAVRGYLITQVYNLNSGNPTFVRSIQAATIEATFLTLVGQGTFSLDLIIY